MFLQQGPVGLNQDGSRQASVPLTVSTAGLQRAAQPQHTAQQAQPQTSLTREQSTAPPQVRDKVTNHIPLFTYLGFQCCC